MTRRIYDCRIAVIFVLSLTLSSCLKEATDDGPGNGQPRPTYTFNWPAIADSSYTALNGNFWNQGGKFYNENSAGKSTFHYWRNAQVLDVLLDAYLRKDDPQIKAHMDELLDGMKSNNNNTYINFFYDDMEWMTLACLRAFETTGDAKYKATADLLWNDIRQGWDDSWGGGIHWNKDKSKNYKNTPANAPACIIAARMYQLAHQPADLEWAKKIYQWQKSTLVDPATGVVWDGINQDGSGTVNKSWLFTYNQGTFIGAGVELYKITGDAVYINDALKTANNALGGTFTQGNILRDEGGGDGGLFKGILVRYLLLLITDGNLGAADATRFAGFLKQNAETLWLKGTSRPQILFSTNWQSIPTAADLTTQLSGAMLIEAVAKLKEQGVID